MWYAGLNNSQSLSSAPTHKVTSLERKPSYAEPSRNMPQVLVKASRKPSTGRHFAKNYGYPS